MSGHSKWATIHRQKEVNDAKRGQAFTKLTMAIIVAVRAGGGVTDPESNFRLRLAIDRARELNMPKENIQRAINRGAGEGGADQWEEVVYEGYGPNGIAVVVEAATNSKQRTGQEIKNIMEKNGGTLAGPGAVAYQFERAGLLTVKKEGSAEEQILKIMDLGVDDVEETEETLEVYTQPENLAAVRQQLEQTGNTVTSYELTMKPKNTVPVSEKAAVEKVLSFMRKLEEQPDVQRVFANFDIPEEMM